MALLTFPHYGERPANPLYLWLARLVPLSPRDFSDAEMLRPGWWRLARLYDFGGDLVAFNTGMLGVCLIATTLTCVNVVRFQPRPSPARWTLVVVLLSVLFCSEFLARSYL